MIPWVQTVVATASVDKEKIADRWVCIFDSKDAADFGNKPLVQLWVGKHDMKDCLHDFAKEDFGDALQQIVRMGSYPKIEYQQQTNL